MDIVKVVSEFGFPVVMAGGLGYFVYFLCQTITNVIVSAGLVMKGTIISLTDPRRLLDQDLIRFQQKLNISIQVQAQ